MNYTLIQGATIVYNCSLVLRQISFFLQVVLPAKIMDFYIFIHGATQCTFFADANPLFALIPEPINQPLQNNYIIRNYTVHLIMQMDVYGIVYTCYAHEL